MDRGMCYIAVHVDTQVLLLYLQRMSYSATSMFIWLQYSIFFLLERYVNMSYSNVPAILRCWLFRSPARTSHSGACKKHSEKFPYWQNQVEIKDTLNVLFHYYTNHAVGHVHTSKLSPDSSSWERLSYMHMHLIKIVNCTLHPI